MYAMLSNEKSSSWTVLYKAWDCGVVIEGRRRGEEIAGPTNPVVVHWREHNNPIIDEDDTTFILH